MLCREGRTWHQAKKSKIRGMKQKCISKNEWIVSELAEPFLVGKERV